MADTERVSQLLTRSRAAHTQGRKHARQKHYAEMRESFAAELALRIEARTADPDYTDPSWAEDLTSLHSRKELEEILSMRLVKAKDAPDPEGYAERSRRRVGADGLLAELAKVDLELEAYYRQKIGEDGNTHSQVDLTDPAAVIVPDEWRTVTAGAPPCGVCAHPKARHPSGQACAESVFDAGDVKRCPCEGYAPLPCRHTWVFDTGQHRRCAACSEQQQLFPKLAVEDTDAYKQLQREAKARH